MILMQGKGVSKGVVKGPMYFFRRQDNTVTCWHADNSEAALSRFASILDMAYADGYYQLAEGASYVYHARSLAAN